MSQFSIQQLKYVVAVAESGSITEAAKRLMISQPSLSEAVKQIEKKIGSPIFSRSPQGLPSPLLDKNFWALPAKLLRK